MEKIKRPIQVTRAEQAVLSEKNFQANVKQQFTEVYDKLDEIVNVFNTPTEKPEEPEKEPEEEPEEEPEVITEKVIFEGSATSPTLTDDVSDFKEIIVYYSCNRSSHTLYGSKIIPIVATTQFAIGEALSVNDAGNVKCACTTYSASGTKITAKYANQYEVKNGAVGATNQSNSFTITKVIGIY